MLDIDYGAVRTTATDAARRAFARVRGAHPDERFYAFALCTDLEVRGLCASANTEEGYRRRLERNEKSRRKIEERIAKSGLTWADYTNYFRWNLPEWAYHRIEGGDFRALDPLILDPIDAPDVDLEEEDPEGFDEHRARVCGSMILAMKDLDEEGLFGAGRERDAVVLLCDLVEPPEKYWFAVESARFLNPPEVFAGFLKQWLAWLGPGDRAVIDDPPAHSPIYRPLRAFLDGGASIGGVS